MKNKEERVFCSPGFRLPLVSMVGLTSLLTGALWLSGFGVTCI